MKQVFQRAYGGCVVWLGICLFATGAPADEEPNRRVTEQRTEMAALVSRIEQALVQENAAEAEALLAVSRTFIRPEIGVSYEMRLVELRLNLSALRAKLAIRKAEEFASEKDFQEAVGVLVKIQGDFTVSLPKPEDSLRMLDAAKSRILQQAADAHLARIETLISSGKAVEAGLLYDASPPSILGHSLLKYLGVRYQNIGPMIGEAKAKELKERQARVNAEMDALIARIKTGIQEKQAIEKWKGLADEGNQMLESLRKNKLTGLSAGGRLEQAVQILDALTDITSALHQGQVELAAQNAGALVSSLHGESIVGPDWIETFVFGHVAESLTPGQLEKALSENPDYAELLRRWVKSQRLYRPGGWPVVKGGYGQAKLDLEFCRDLDSMIREEVETGLGNLVQRWSGLQGSETVTNGNGRALVFRAFLLLSRKAGGLSLQRREGEDLQTLIKRALAACAKEGKFGELALFMPEAVKFAGQDYSAVDPFSEAPLVASYLAAGRLEAAGDRAEAARLYRIIVQRGTTLYLPIQKAQERLTALLPSLKVSDEAGELKAEIARIQERVEKLEREIAGLRKP